MRKLPPVCRLTVAVPMIARSRPSLIGAPPSFRSIELGRVARATTPARSSRSIDCCATSLPSRWYRMFPLEHAFPVVSTHASDTYVHHRVPHRVFQPLTLPAEQRLPSATQLVELLKHRAHRRRHGRASLVRSSCPNSSMSSGGGMATSSPRSASFQRAHMLGNPSFFES